MNDFKTIEESIQDAWFPMWLNAIFSTGLVGLFSGIIYCLVMCFLSGFSIDNLIYYLAGFLGFIALFLALIEAKSLLYYMTLYSSFCDRKPSRSAVEFYLKNHQYQGVASKAALEQYLLQDKEG